MSNTVNILYQFDDCFAPIAGVSITSLFENNKHIPELRLYVIDGGISDENRDKLDRLSARYQRSILFIDGKSIDRMLENQGARKWRNSYAAYYKVYAIERIPDEIDRLLSLDGDTIINGKIDPLYYVDLDGKTFGMVQDYAPPTYLKKIGIGKENQYFNTGVILFDVQRWKQLRCHEKVEQFFSADKQTYFFPEQDAVNLLFPSEIRKISIGNNFFAVIPALIERLALTLDTVYRMYDMEALGFYSRNELSAAENDALIYHYLGGSIVGRPWEQGTGGRLFELWDSYLAISPWKGLAKQSSHGSSYHRIEKCLSQLLPGPIFAFIYKLAYRLYFEMLLRKRT